MSRMTTLHISKEAHKFSAAHFTIFSATERERLHGHNYAVSARILAPMGPNGFSADYNVYKRRIMDFCARHDEYMLLPDASPYLQVSQEGDDYVAVFNGRSLRFPVDETLLLPMVNVTVEELAHYCLREIVAASAGEALSEVEVFVSSGSGQAGSAIWAAEHKK